MFKLYVFPKGKRVNLRKSPSIKSISLGKFSEWDQFSFIEVAEPGDGFLWLKVQNDLHIGFFRIDVVSIRVNSAFDGNSDLVIEDFIGQNEIPSNMGFVTKWFDEKMREVGFKDSHPWCAYYMRVLLKWFHFEYSYVSPSVMNTVSAYKKKAKKKSLEMSTDKLSLACWQNFKNNVGLHTGHIGLCISASKDHFITLEGNTNAVGSREGFTTALKVRHYKTDVKNGLRFIGFIPIDTNVLTDDE